MKFATALLIASATAVRITQKTHAAPGEDATHEEIFNYIDADNNGEVTIAEFTTACEAHRDVCPADAQAWIVDHMEGCIAKKGPEATGLTLDEGHDCFHESESGSGAETSSLAKAKSKARVHKKGPKPTEEDFLAFEAEFGDSDGILTTAELSAGLDQAVADGKLPADHAAMMLDFFSTECDDGTGVDWEGAEACMRAGKEAYEEAHGESLAKLFAKKR